jgi:hypothetical protein
MILADALGTTWFIALVASVSVALGWWLKSKYGSKVKF